MMCIGSGPSGQVLEADLEEIYFYKTGAAGTAMRSSGSTPAIGGWTR